MSEDHAPIRVLHVERDEAVADETASELERRNDRFEVETVGDAAAALERIEAEEPDCVLSGYDLPETDGIEFLQAVREAHPDLPFVIYTGAGSEQVASEAFAAGATDYLRKDSGGEQYAVLANRIETVVEERRARAARLETERHLSELADQTDDVLWMQSADWDEVLFVNEAYEEVYGRSRERLHEDSQDFLEAIHPEDREDVMEAMARVSAGESVEIEYRVNEAEDFERWVWVQGRPVTDADGEVVRVAGFSRDITERKDRERELEQYETIVETIPEGVFVIDEEGVIRGGNERAAAILGYGVDELQGESFERLIEDGVYPPGIIDTYIEAVRELLSSETDRETAQFDQPVTIDGEERVFEVLLALRPFEEEFRGTIGVVRDVTEEKRKQRTLREQNERLEEFAGIVSHDLRNPLNVAQGRLDLARAECDSAHLDAVDGAHDRMERLIEDLLAIAREGESPADVAPVDLADIAHSCWEGVVSSDADLEVDLEATVRADEMRLRELLENLFRNAVEHGSTSPPSQAQEDAVEHGGEDVTVTVSELPDGFYVADDGPGIPEAEREGVFEYGYSTADDGTGLGLSIVRRIATAHEWDVDVTESEDGGARFEVTGVEFVED